MKQWYMVIDVATCQDCNSCLMACKDEHVDNEWPDYTEAQPRRGHYWIDVHRHERGQYPRIDVSFRPTPCQHCEDAPCIKAGDGAVRRRKDGIVMIDPERARGNQDLLTSCPYGAIFWNSEKKIAQKCTMCAHLLDSENWLPGVPRCVHNCPTGSLKMVNVEQAEMNKIVEAESLTVLRPELRTKPHVFYKNLHLCEKNFISAGVLIDEDCFEGATVTLKSHGTVCAMEATNCFGDFKFDGLDNGEYVIEIDAGGITVSETVKIDNKSLNLGFIRL
ncbi:MAG: oxidoreductase [Desulfofustis sp.]|nr:hypothetical protein [Desulfofustis sp.]MBT8345104.1 hypothetical protein [Desulfofustis sp.]MBT8355011.1 hypothetical protein [Desulfofustis sp.]NNF45495.1 oxidoreductase [Desulfofustis sp.]NNK14932.1 oxidoreductase [Desulfofustis sp.]